MMKSGIPLEDADRWDWLIRLRDAAVTELLSGNSGVVLACSALKKRYRDVLRIASYFNNQIATHFVCLDVNEVSNGDTSRPSTSNNLIPFTVFISNGNGNT